MGRAAGRDVLGSPALLILPASEGLRDTWVAICNDPHANRARGRFLFGEEDAYIDMHPSLTDLVVSFTRRWKLGVYSLDGSVLGTSSTGVPGLGASEPRHGP